MKLIKHPSLHWLPITFSLSTVLLTGCGGSSGTKYEAVDTVDRAPYFSVSGNAVKNGTAIDASTLKAMPIKFFDDKGLKSYDFTIEGQKISAGDITGTEASVDIDISQYAGNTQYSAKLLVVDSANQSTTAYFTINMKTYYEHMQLIGSATPNGWDNHNPTPMVVDANNPAIFSWRGSLTSGEFKIATEETVDWGSGDWIHPLTGGQSLSSTDYQVETASGPDTKWAIPNGGQGIYTITLDQKERKILIGKPLTQLFIVGSATPIGWNLGNAMPFDHDPTNVAKFTLTLALTAGEFKFSSQHADWGSGDWIYAGGNSSLSTTATMFDLSLADANGKATSHADNKWQVSGADAGTYKITIDLDAGTIFAEKQ